MKVFVFVAVAIAMALATEEVERTKKDSVFSGYPYGIHGVRAIGVDDGKYYPGKYEAKSAVLAPGFTGYPYSYGAYPYSYGAYPYSHGAYAYSQGAYPYSHGAYPYSHGAFPFNYYGQYAAAGKQVVY